MAIEIKADPKAIQRAIRDIEALDLQTVSFDQLDQLLTPILRGYGVTAPRFDPPLYIFRGRKCAKPKNISEITYPPPEFAKLVRANDAGESLFYAATARNVPFFELGVKEGDFLALSQWKTNSPLLLNHIGFSSEPDCFLESDRDIDKIYQFVKSTRSQSDINELVHDYLAAKFSRFVPADNEDYYKLTLAIARKMFRDDIFDGLLYPTIQMRGNADNIVLKPSFVDKSLKLVSLEWVVVKATRDMQYDIDILDSATQVEEDGTISWSGRTLQWKLERQGEKLEMVSEGGAWVAYDEAGQRVDPN